MKKITLIIMAITLAAGSLLFTTGCAQSNADEERTVNGQMADYYSIVEVKEYHEEFSNALNDTVKAMSEGDEAALEKQLVKLDDMCDSFIATTDIPEALEPYHNKMVEIAKLEKKFTSSIRAAEYEQATETLSEINKQLEEAKKLLPQGS